MVSPQYAHESSSAFIWCGPDVARELAVTAASDFLDVAVLFPAERPNHEKSRAKMLMKRSWERWALCLNVVTSGD